MIRGLCLDRAYASTEAFGLYFIQPRAPVRATRPSFHTGLLSLKSLPRSIMVDSITFTNYVGTGFWINDHLIDSEVYLNAMEKTVQEYSSTERWKQ